MHCWYLVPGNYRAYKLPLSMLGEPTKIQSCQLDNSIVNIRCSPQAMSPSSSREALLVLHMSIVLLVVKEKRLDLVIEFVISWVISIS